jgi:hypothetical protein
MEQQPAHAAPGLPSPSAVRRVERNKAGNLVVTLPGREEPVAEARVARCFPHSIPDRFVSIRDKDGKEVALLDRLDALDPSSRALVEQEIHDKIFTPRITRILSHKDEFGVASITADTDRGRVTFQIRSRDDVRVASSARAFFRDADGNVYEVPDVRALDRASQKVLLEYF